MTLRLHFLGAGNAHSHDLGNACAVLERDGAPLLCIDYGHTAHAAYLRAYQRLPDAIFVTHPHLDHIGGLEALFYASVFGVLSGEHAPIRLYVPAALVALVHARLAAQPTMLAEGAVNFWDAFHLIPVGADFWHQGVRYDVFEARHQAPRFCYGIALPGRFVYTGDTRPIPEVLVEIARDSSAIVFHDCALRGNPAHAGIDDIVAEYPEDLVGRMVMYHLASIDECMQIEAAGHRVARPGDRFDI